MSEIVEQTLHAQPQPVIDQIVVKLEPTHYLESTTRLITVTVDTWSEQTGPRTLVYQTAMRESDVASWLSRYFDELEDKINQACHRQGGISDR